MSRAKFGIREGSQGDGAIYTSAPEIVASVTFFPVDEPKVLLMRRTDTGEVEPLSGKLELIDVDFPAVARRETEQELTGRSIESIPWHCATHLGEVTVVLPDRKTGDLNRKICVVRFLVPLTDTASVRIRSEELRHHDKLESVDLRDTQLGNLKYRSGVEEFLKKLADSWKARGTLLTILNQTRVTLKALFVDRLPNPTAILLERRGDGDLVLPKDGVLPGEHIATGTLARKIRDHIIPIEHHSDLLSVRYASLAHSQAHDAATNWHDFTLFYTAVVCGLGEGGLPPVRSHLVWQHFPDMKSDMAPFLAKVKAEYRMELAQVLKIFHEASSAAISMSELSLSRESIAPHAVPLPGSPRGFKL